MLDARIRTENELQQESSAIQKMYKRVPFVYAHGKLKDDLGTDIVYLFLGDNKLCNRLVAYTSNMEPVMFHLYKHPRTFELVGVVTYCCDDKEAYEYGKKLVEDKPEKF